MRWISTLFLLFCLYQPALAADIGIQGYDILVVGGQSNAVGWGIPDGPNSAISNHKIFQWDWQKSGIEDQPAQEPIKTPAAANPRKIHGFSLPFAQIYSQKVLARNRALLIINGAVGGSSIREWTPQGEHYTRLISAVQKVLQQPKLSNKVIGILWHQGEADVKLAATDPDWRIKGAHYQNQLHDIVLAFQKDLVGRDAQTPVFIAGEMSREWTEHRNIKDYYVQMMRQSLQGLEKTGFVESNNLSGNAKDKIHFDGASQLQLGQRYFKKFNDLTQVAPFCRNIF